MNVIVEENKGLTGRSSGTPYLDNVVQITITTDRAFC